MHLQPDLAHVHRAYFRRLGKTVGTHRTADVAQNGLHAFVVDELAEHGADKIIVVDDSKLKSKGADLSYSLRAHSRTDTERYGERLTNDKSQRKNTQFTYENFTQTPLWDHFKISYSSQKITNNARTDEYCYTSKCIQVENKQGLHLDDSNGVYKVVDKTGGEITGKVYSKFYLGDCNDLRVEIGNGKSIFSYR